MFESDNLSNVLLSYCFFINIQFCSSTNAKVKSDIVREFRKIILYV